MHRYPLPLVCFVAVLAVALSGSAGASNGLALGQNVDPSLASLITGAASGVSPGVSGYGSGKYHVLVFGGGGFGVTWRDRLANIGAQSATLTATQISQLSATPGIQWIEPDTAVAPTGQAPSPVSAAQLATLYPQIDGAPSLWANGVTGAGVGVAIIDSGVTPRTDFGSRLVQVQIPTYDGTSPDDSIGHGSAVAGVAAGQSPDGKYIGIAPGATVYAIDVARADGVYTSDVIAGLDWVLQNAKANNIGVVNLSLTETTPSSYFTSALDAAVDQLWSQGIVVVVSSGNFGPNSEEFAPANDPWVITVGASDTNDTLGTADDSLASFSSYGTTPDGFSKPEIVAPGRHIVTTIPASSTIAQSAPAGYLVGSGEDNYVRISGTSFSAPQVTGAAALLLQLRHSLTPDQVKWLLTNNERSLAGSDAGALDLGAAAAALAHPDAANKGEPHTRLSQFGATTSDFLNALGIAQAVSDEQSATVKDTLAQVSCARAAATSFLLKRNGAAYADCAGKLDSAAAAWDTAAGEFDSAGFDAAAGTAETYAAADWQTAAADWTKAGNAASAAADTASQSAALSKAAAWDAAAWDSAAWDSAAWDGTAWDAAAWDKATAWDHSAAWDAAAWDSAAWDAAAWDAAAWD